MNTTGQEQQWPKSWIGIDIKENQSEHETPRDGSRLPVSNLLTLPFTRMQTEQIFLRCSSTDVVKARPHSSRPTIKKTEEKWFAKRSNLA